MVSQFQNLKTKDNHKGQPMKKLIAVMTLMLLLVSFAGAQAAASSSAQTPAASAVPVSGFKKEFLSNYDTLFKKMIDLATKMPEEKYDWRPAEGVRSIGEVYLHLGISNYGLARPFGAQFPTDINLRTLEKSKP